MEYVLLLLIGIIAGTFGGLVGLGGGVIVVPSLLFISSMGWISQTLAPNNAVGISLMVIIFTGISATIYNSRQKRVDFKSGLFFFVAGGPMAMIGGMVNKYVHMKLFYLLFGLVMLLITYLLARKEKMKPKKVSWQVKREYTDPQGNKYEYGYNRWIAFAITGFAGFIAGLFGIGGGAILVPMMVILFHFPPHVATATSLFIILLSASSGSISHIIIGNIIYHYAIVIGIGAYLGGNLGSYLSSKMSSKGLIIALRLVIVFVAIQLIYKGIF
ncbi:sulfite exporter TauE/SafE family protein [Tepidibacillus marianensis]|uniref:sulfite exporter TauE/SafE family protein n=1 Tax=Tepidibacillus marianensis TaxID=3131995 RepID=UPI0030CC3A4C